MMGADLIREIEAVGWLLDRVRGAHNVFKHPRRPGHIVVPHPKKDLGVGLVAAIRKQAGVQGPMRYPIAIELGAPDSAFGVVVPDLPGCFSAGDTLDEALSAVEEAAAAWIDAALDAGEPIPAPSSLDALSDNPDFHGWAFGVTTVARSLLDDSIERVNISLPRRVPNRLDALAQAAGQTRSGFIAELTLRSGRTAEESKDSRR